MMIDMKTSRMVGMVVWMWGLCAGAMAQKNIDKVVADMEKHADTRVTSIKKRDPETRKVVKVTKILRLTDVQIAKRAMEAFEKDEEDALTSIKEKRTRVEYTLTYQNKTEKRTYMLNIREGNDVEISVFITPAKGQEGAWLGKDDIRQLTALQRIDMEDLKEKMRTQQEAMRNLKTQLIEIDGKDVYINGQRMPRTTTINGNVAVVE